MLVLCGCNKVSYPPKKFVSRCLWGAWREGEPDLGEQHRLGVLTAGKGVRALGWEPRRRDRQADWPRLDQLAVAPSRGHAGPGREPGPSLGLGSCALGLPQQKRGELQGTDSLTALAARSIRSERGQDSAPPGGSTGNPSLPLPASGGCWHYFSGGSIAPISTTGAGPRCCLLPRCLWSLNLGPTR